MKTLNSLFHQKIMDKDFKALYQSECNVCQHTVAIFAKLHAQGITTARIAGELNIPVQELDALADADFCNPDLVIRLCRHLNLETNPDCPKKNAGMPFCSKGD